MNIERVENILETFANVAWGLPLLILLIGGGIYFGILSGFLPLRYTLSAIKRMLKLPKEKESAEGMISPFQALNTALSSTIGMGNIAGVAVAISIGGPGAIFWMWVSAIIGMVTKFFTCTLSVMYRKHNEDGTLDGGPMYFIEYGLGKKWKPLASFFAFVGLLGVIPVFNVNQLTQAFRDIILIPMNVEVGFKTNLIFGIFITTLTALVIFGGIKRIGKIAEKLVPFMVILYFISILFIVFSNITKLPDVFALIFTEAFTPTYFKGDSFLGGTLGGLILLGVRRGAFSNEAGIGTAPMAHGASTEKEPLHEGFSAMLGPLIDTIIVCTLTAVAIIITDVWKISESNGVTLTSQAFNVGIPYIGDYILMLCISVFSISSLFSFSYYGTKCTAYLIGKSYAHNYNWLYLFSILVGSITTIDMMINLIDGLYALMAIPTMVATIILSPKVVKRLRKYNEQITQ